MSSDDEQQWTPSKKFRPQSTIVQNFSADLDSIFGMTPEIDSLSQTIEQKQRTVSSAEQELQALQARLRATEQRLAKVSRGNSPSRPEDNNPHTGNEPTTTTAAAAATAGGSSRSPLSHRPVYPADRPPTAGQQQQQQPPLSRRGYENHASAGAGGSNGEYVMVDRTQQ